MNDSIPVHSSPNYNMIIARYVEIGLKSRKVRNRMENRLLEHIQSILKRESVLCEEAYNKWGRLIFEIPNEYQSKALQIFRNIIGIHSYSPVIRVSTHLNSLYQSVLDFAQDQLQDNDVFAVKVKRFKTYPKNSLELEKELGAQIINSFEKRGLKLHVDLKNPQKTIYLEVKEKYAYLFGNIYYSAWGGNPIEIDKAMFAVWKGTPGELPSAFLLTRRGTVVIPVILYNYNHKSSTSDEIQTKSPSVHNKLKILSTFYARNLPYFYIDMGLAAQFWEEYTTTHDNYKPDLDISKDSFLNGIALMVLSRMMEIDEIKNQITYGNQAMTIKGVILNCYLKNNSSLCPWDYIKFAQSQNLSCFFPLMGVPTPVVDQIEQNLTNPGVELITSEFSLSSLISPFLAKNWKNIGEIKTSGKEAKKNQNTGYYQIDLDKLIKTEEIKLLVQKTLESCQIRSISSRFFD